MTTDENILEEMLGKINKWQMEWSESLSKFSERSTNPRKDDVDNMAVQMFCMIVNSNKGDLVNKAHELIVKKIRSQNITEANRAIGVSGK